MAALAKGSPALRPVAESGWHHEKAPRPWLDEGLFVFRAFFAANVIAASGVPPV